MGDSSSILAPLDSPPGRRLRVAWISGFPIEWLPDAEQWVGPLPKRHPMSWQRVLLTEFERYPELDLHIIVVRRDLPTSRRFVRNGVTFHLIKTWPWVRASSGFWVDTFLIRRLLRTIMPELVHAWGTETGAALVASRLHYPTLASMQGILSWLDTKVPLNRYHRWAARLEQTSLRRLSSITVESAFGQKYLQDRFPLAKVYQIEHAPNDVFFSVTRRPQLLPRKIVSIGDLNYAKGGDVLVGILNQLRHEIDFRLTVVGNADPQMLAKLKLTQAPEIWSRLVFKQNLTPVELAKELAEAALLIHASRADNSPNAVKEAVVAGVPVLASRTGGIPDYVFPGENGGLFEPGDAREGTAALRQLLEHPVLGQGAVVPETWQRCRDYLSPARMARIFFETYLKVCGLMMKPSTPAQSP